MISSSPLSSLVPNIILTLLLNSGWVSTAAFKEYKADMIGALLSIAPLAVSWLFTTHPSYGGTLQLASSPSGTTSIWPNMAMYSSPSPYSA